MCSCVFFRAHFPPFNPLQLNALPASALPEQIIRALIASFLATDRQLKDEVRFSADLSECHIQPPRRFMWDV